MANGIEKAVNLSSAIVLGLNQLSHNVDAIAQAAPLLANSFVGILSSLLVAFTLPFIQVSQVFKSSSSDQAPK